MVDLLVILIKLLVEKLSVGCVFSSVGWADVPDIPDSFTDDSIDWFKSL